MLTIGYLIGAGGDGHRRRSSRSFLGVDAEGKSLEDVATPLSVVAEPEPVAA